MQSSAEGLKNKRDILQLHHPLSPASSPAPPQLLPTEGEASGWHSEFHLFHSAAQAHVIPWFPRQGCHWGAAVPPTFSGQLPMAIRLFGPGTPKALGRPTATNSQLEVGGSLGTDHMSSSTCPIQTQTHPLWPTRVRLAKQF